MAEQSPAGSKGWQFPVLFVLCVLAGVGLGIGGLRVYSSLSAKPQAALRRLPPVAPQAQPPAPTPAATQPQSPPLPAKPPAGVAGAKQETKPEATGGPKPQNPPVNPFGGLVGVLPDKGLGMLPAISQPEAAKPPPPPEEWRLVELSMPGDDAQKVAGIAKQFSASTKAVTEFQGERHTPVDGLLLFVPPGKTQPLLTALTGVGATVAFDWKGGSADRQRVLTEKSATLLRDLQRKRQELLVRYFEDAIPVRDLDDQIAAVTAALKQYNERAPAKADTVKVLFLPN